MNAALNGEMVTTSGADIEAAKEANGRPWQESLVEASTVCSLRIW